MKLNQYGNFVSFWEIIGELNRTTTTLRFCHTKVRMLLKFSKQRNWNVDASSRGKLCFKSVEVKSNEFKRAPTALLAVDKLVIRTVLRIWVCFILENFIREFKEMGLVSKQFSAVEKVEGTIKEARWKMECFFNNIFSFCAMLMILESDWENGKLVQTVWGDFKETLGSVRHGRVSQVVNL